MRRLYVAIEIEGRMREVGMIAGDNEFTAEFRYSDDYLAQETARPISLSLPLTDQPYGPAQTRSFLRDCFRKVFSGVLLPKTTEQMPEIISRYSRCSGRNALAQSRSEERILSASSLSTGSSIRI